jgi:hypothetical protein
MDRFNELLQKRKNMTANIFEEEELIELAKSMSEEQLKDVDKKLLTYSNDERLDSLNASFDKLLAALDKK